MFIFGVASSRAWVEPNETDRHDQCTECHSCSFTIKLSSPAHTGRRGGSIPTLAARVRGPSLKFLPHSWQTITFFIPFRLQRHLLLLLAFHPLTITLLQLCEASVYHADFARPVGWATLDSCIPVLVGLEIQKRILDLQVQARVSLGVRFHCQRRPKFLAGPSDPQGKQTTYSGFSSKWI